MNVDLQEITKAFDGNEVLTGVDLHLRSGEAHALLGENGAGKSTLIKILCGIHQPTAGRIIVDGRQVVMTAPQDAVDLGISVVQQERNLVPGFSVAENVLLNRAPRRRGLIDERALHEEAARWLELVGVSIDVRQEAGRLSPGQGQLLEIARALSLRSKVVLLDEPTASIGLEETERLFALLRSLKENGTALLFVSHKLEEVYEVCDRVTVIRDGRAILRGAQLADNDRDQLVEAMVGREYVHVTLPAKPPAGRPALELRGYATRWGHRDVDLVVQAGEVVALYGLIGAGRTELARAIVGLDRAAGGQCLVNGNPASPRGTAAAVRKHRLGYVSEDRKGEGLIISDTIRRNASITIWSRLASRLGWISEAPTGRAVLPQLQRLGVKMRALDQRVSELSGGNQQKISVSKWVSAGVDVLIVDEPTVGVDVSAKEEIHRVLWELAAEGTAIFMISSDLREVVQMADRVLVMAGGELRAEFANVHDYEQMSRQIMSAIVRHGQPTAAA